MFCNRNINDKCRLNTNGVYIVCAEGLLQ